MLTGKGSRERRVTGEEKRRVPKNLGPPRDEWGNRPSWAMLLAGPTTYTSMLHEVSSVTTIICLVEPHHYLLDSGDPISELRCTL